MKVKVFYNVDIPDLRSLIGQSAYLRSVDEVGKIISAGDYSVNLQFGSAHNSGWWHIHSIELIGEGIALDSIELPNIEMKLQ